MAYVDLSKCNQPDRYVIYPEYPSHAETNCKFYKKYFGYEFQAWNAYEAFQKAKSLQEKCEQAQSAAGIELCDMDPCFVENLYRIESDGDDALEKIEPSFVFEVRKINKENVEGVKRFQLNDYDYCCPKVRKNAIIYDFSDDDLNDDYGDGRVIFDGREYTAVSLNLTGDPENDDWEFLGYVDSSDLI